MLVEWMMSCGLPKLIAGADEVKEKREPQTPTKKASNSNSGSSTSKSTPLAAPVKIDTETALIHLCCRNECGKEWASDAAASFVADEYFDDEAGGTPQHLRLSRRTNSNRGRKQSFKRSSSSKVANGRRQISPPESITVYRPKRTWPDGTLQILWEKKEGKAFGLKGVDKFHANIDLALDDLSTIEMMSDIGSQVCDGTTIEVHPNETTLMRVGTMSCYLIRPSALRNSLDETNEKHMQAPALLRTLLKKLDRKNQMFQSWRKSELTKQGVPESSIQELYWKHLWHRDTSVASYLWIEDIHIDERYRGVGLGLCLVEDACRKVADTMSWVLVSPPTQSEGGKPESSKLQDYFELMGFCPLTSPNKADPVFLARWNASPLNPRLDEALPSVPSTAQQSKDQGFHL